VEYRERPIRILAQLDPSLDVVGAHRALRQLQPAPRMGNGVVAANPLAVLYLRVSTIEQTTANQERELLGPGEVGPRMRFSKSLVRWQT
jgi:hypothetical protein